VAFEDDDNSRYMVVVNHEEQYSIWPEEMAPPPAGWRTVAKNGTKKECLDYIEEVWTDMRPLSLRRKMEEMAAKGE
jgi:MbtH protein